MKSLVLALLLFTCFARAEESVTQKIDRSAQEAVDEVKTAGKTIIQKMKKNTNSEKDPESADSKKKVQRDSKGVIMSDNKNLQTATVAGGCFWGVEELLRKVPGIEETEVGYTGGKADTANYEIVKTGTTGHAEAVQIKFDPKKITYADVLGHFFRLHDPTTLNRQENDVGTQYRSSIFYHNDEQKKIAQQVKEKVDTSGKWKKPVVTQIVPFEHWYPAETYHQDYLQKNPQGYNCHYYRD